MEKYQITSFTAYIRKNERGFYCRIPTVVRDYDITVPVFDDDDFFLGYDYGYKEVPGKYCFPVKGCENQICEGLADITIVNEKANYAFFTAEMIQYKIPAEDALLEWFEQHKQFMQHTMTYKRNGLKGSYVVLKRQVDSISDIGSCILAAADNSGKAVMIDDDCCNAHDGAAEENVMRVDEFVFKAHNHNSTLAETVAKYKNFEFHSFYTTSTYRHINALFDDAIDSELVYLKEVYGVMYAELGNISTVAYKFSQDELDSIIAEVNRINDAANAAIKSKIRSGKLPCHKLDNGLFSIDHC